MGLHLYLVGVAKVGADLFGLPDVYTYVLSRRNCLRNYHIIPFSLFIDTIAGFYLGTFFFVDLVAYFLWNSLKRYLLIADSAFILYIIRYSLLYFFGMPFVLSLEQFCYCFFFIVFFEHFNFKKFLPVHW